MLQQMRNAVHGKQIFLVVDGSTLSGIHLNILVGSLGTPHISYLYNCQPLPCASNNNTIAKIVDDGVRSLAINRNFYLLLCGVKNIRWMQVRY